MNYYNNKFKTLNNNFKLFQLNFNNKNYKIN